MRRLAQANASGRGMELGLERMAGLATARGLFRGRSPDFIHVAGTNGKGTTCAKIRAGLESAGVAPVGLFTSPHVVTFRERIQVSRRLIPEECADALNEEIDALERDTQLSPTYFERLTLMALMHFEAEGVQAAVVEAGLGGLLDSTNVIPSPRVCVITSVGLDHQDFLGPTLEDIARNKGGIIKARSHVVVGPRVAPVQVLRELADQAGAASFTQVDCPADVPLDLQNATVAQVALQRFGCEVPLAALEGERLPGRFERFELPRSVAGTGAPAPRQVVLDGAHNPEAMQMLNRELRRTFPGARFTFVMAMAQNKDHRACLQALCADLDAAAILFTPSDNAARTAAPDALVDAARSVGLTTAPVTSHQDSLAAFDAAAARADPSEVIVVCGSFNVLGRLRVHRLLATDLELDAVNLNESKL